MPVNTKDACKGAGTVGQRSVGTEGWGGSAVPQVVPAGPGLGGSRLAPVDAKLLLDLARQALLNLTTNTSLPEVTHSAALTEWMPCFVTLTKGGQLRGCVGQLVPQGPLFRTVIENVRGAATRDPRFPAITAEEVGQLKIEISLLSEPKPLHCASPEELLQRLRPGEDGVLLRVGQSVATFLPQVWEQIPDKVQFLEHLAQKAGCPASAWRDKDVEISVYQVDTFTEN